MANLQFDANSTKARRAVVVSFDLCGFSTFCKHPEAHAILPKFISGVFEQFNAVLRKFFQQHMDPDFIKYTGDGAIIIWFLAEDSEERQVYCTAIVAAMRKFQSRLTEIIPKWEIDWQIDRLPQPARFGIATGLVYPLRCPDTGKEIDYAGYCINLAVRLQDHFPEVGFVIHELVFPKLEGLMKYIAHGMKGTLSEPVLIFYTDFPAVSIEQITSKFSPCGPESPLRCEATNRMVDMSQRWKDEKTPGIVQPRFQAVLEGPGKRMQDMFIDAPHPEFKPIWEERDAAGNRVGEAVYVFKLVSNGPPLRYQFVRREPHVPTDVKKLKP